MPPPLLAQLFAPSQVHLILRHKSPKTGKIEEKHLKSPPFVETDAKTHVYTAILRASNNRCAAWGSRLCIAAVHSLGGTACTACGGLQAACRAAGMAWALCCMCRLPPCCMDG